MISQHAEREKRNCIIERLTLTQQASTSSSFVSLEIIGDENLLIRAFYVSSPSKIFSRFSVELSMHVLDLNPDTPSLPMHSYNEFANNGGE